jgi:hypothetical protein
MRVYFITSCERSLMYISPCTCNLRRVWRYQKGQSESINGRTDNTTAERKRTNNDLKNITQKTKDRVTRTPLTIGGELSCSWRVSGSCSTSDIRRATLVTNPVISHEWGKDREVLRQVEHILVIIRYTYIVDFDPLDSRYSFCFSVQYLRPTWHRKDIL